MDEERRELQKAEDPAENVVEGEIRDVEAREPGGLAQPPLHPLSSLVTIALDGVWSVPEFASLVSIGGLPALPVLAAGAGLTCLAAVTLVQKFVSRDEWGASVAKGFALGIIAGVPFPFTGTAAGSLLLLWTGAHALFKRRQLPPG